MRSKIVLGIASLALASGITAVAQVTVQKSPAAVIIENSETSAPTSASRNLAHETKEVSQSETPSVDVNRDLPDAPSAVQTTAYAGLPSGNERHGQAAPPAATGGIAYGEQRAMDWKFGLMTGALFASSVADAELSLRCLEAHTCAYVPGPLRSRAALYGIGLPTDLFVSYVSLRMKGKGMKYWWVGQAALTAGNAYVALHAARRLP